MKKLIFVGLVGLVASLTACSRAIPEKYFLNGFYNPEKCELTTVDFMGNMDSWSVSVDMLKNQKTDINGDIFVWAEIETNGTDIISDDAVINLYPGKCNVFNDYKKVIVFNQKIYIDSEVDNEK